MNTETGEIISATPEQLTLFGEKEKAESLENKISEVTEKIKNENKGKWLEIPLGEEVTLSNGLKFKVAYARVDTQEVVLKPSDNYKMKLKLK